MLDAKGLPGEGAEAVPGQAGTYFVTSLILHGDIEVQFEIYISVHIKKFCCLQLIQFSLLGACECL